MNDEGTGLSLTHIRPAPSASIHTLSHPLENEIKQSGETGAYERSTVVLLMRHLHWIPYIIIITYNLNTENDDCDYSLGTLDFTRQMWIVALFVVSLTL